MNKKQYIILNSNEPSSTTIQTIDDLVTALSEGERTTYNHIIRSINLSASDFDQYCSWSDDCYTRNCVFENENFQIILLCWCIGQATPIHDHGGEECWVKVIDGELKETVYKQNETKELKVVKSAIAKVNDVTYMKDFMGFHKLENIADKRSLTLHIYAKPIHTCNTFDEISKTFVSKKMRYHTTA